MTKKVGRPTDEPKNHRESVRLSDNDMIKIDYCMKVTGLTKTDVIRKGVDLVYQKLKEKE